MTRPLRFLGLVTLLATSGCVTGGADDGGLTHLSGRLTDQIIARDMARMESLAQRITALPREGDPVRVYAVAKAEAWLVLARTEFTDNDRTGIADFAFRQALDATASVEAGSPQRAWETVIDQSSARVREDLWTRAEALKRHDWFSCAAPLVARLEVRLVWAGNEELTCRAEDPRPHAEAAEALARAAEEAVALCIPPELEPPAPEPELEPPPTPVSLRLPDAVHFAFDRADLALATEAVLSEVAAALEAHPQIAVVIRGHTDQQGDSLYNETLSWNRTEAVIRYLESSGISEDRIQREFRGEREPLSVPGGPDRRTRAGDSPELVDALNRRVELYYRAPPWVTVTRVQQRQDLQPERR